MRSLVFILAALLLATSSAWAENDKVIVHRTSPNHTTIVIHNTSPEAFQKRNEYAREAQRRLEEKRRRKHELELARIEAEARQAEQEAAEQRRRRQEQSRIYQPPPRQRAAFMNGGRPTMGLYGGFSSVGFPSFHYNYAPRPVAGFYPQGRRYCPPPRHSRSRVCPPAPRVIRGRRCR